MMQFSGGPDSDSRARVVRWRSRGAVAPAGITPSASVRGTAIPRVVPRVAPDPRVESAAGGPAAPRLRRVRPGSSRCCLAAGVTPCSTPAACRATAARVSWQASSASSTKASRASSTTGACSPPGRGARAACWTTSRRTRPLTRSTSASRATHAGAKPRSSPWRSTSGSRSGTSAHRVKAAQK